MEDKLSPSISYLQKLGPEYIDQVFESSRWIFEQDRDMAFQVILILFSFCSLLRTSNFFIEDIYVSRRRAPSNSSSGLPR
jgi:hypothetical protein